MILIEPVAWSMHEASLAVSMDTSRGQFECVACSFFPAGAAVDSSQCEVLQTIILSALCCSMP